MGTVSGTKKFNVTIEPDGKSFTVDVNVEYQLTYKEDGNGNRKVPEGALKVIKIKSMYRGMTFPDWYIYDKVNPLVAEATIKGLRERLTRSAYEFSD
jgi:hypothetical protein